jgi:hypothetical protein
MGGESEIGVMELVPPALSPVDGKISKEYSW